MAEPLDLEAMKALLDKETSNLSAVDLEQVQEVVRSALLLGFGCLRREADGRLISMDVSRTVIHDPGVQETAAALMADLVED